MTDDDERLRIDAGDPFAQRVRPPAGER